MEFSLHFLHQLFHIKMYAITLKALPLFQIRMSKKHIFI